VAILNKFDDRGDVHNLEARLREISPTLNELFDDILARDGSNENLLPIIQWTLFSGRPLSATELYHAVIISRHQLDRTTLQLDQRIMNGRILKSFILTSSKGLLQASSSDSDKTDKRNVSYEFFHESVREYCLAHGLRNLDQGLETDVIGASHAFLARSCAAYLNLFHANLPGTWTDVISLEHEPQAPYPFLQYGQDFGLFYHADEAAARGHLPHDIYADISLDKWWFVRPFSQPLNNRQRWQSSPNLRRDSGDDFVRESLRTNSRVTAMRRDATFLHILVECGLLNLVQQELQRHTKDGSTSTQEYVNTECGLLGTALHIALHHGNTKFIQILLSAGADRDVRCKVLGTPKEYAISLSFTNAVVALGGHDTSDDAGAADCAAEVTLQDRLEQIYRRNRELRQGPADHDRIIACKERATLNARDIENSVAMASRGHERIQP
jgi:hypothetical protein